MADQNLVKVVETVLAKSKELIKAFGTDDQTKICIEVSIHPPIQSPVALTRWLLSL